MFSDWFDSLKAGEPDAPLEIVVRFKEELYQHAFGLLTTRLEDPYIAADEIAMTTLERACLHCQRGGFAKLKSETELLDWLHQVSESAVQEYFEMVQRRENVLISLGDPADREKVDLSAISDEELAELVDGFPDSFGDPMTQKVAELFLNQKGIDAIQSELKLTGPSVRRRFDTVEKAFDRAVFSKKT